MLDINKIVVLINILKDTYNWSFSAATDANSDLYAETKRIGRNSQIHISAAACGIDTV